MTNPFAELGLAAEDKTDECLQRFSVGRDEELRHALDALDSGANVLLFGERGAGKTFLARLIECALRERQSTFAVGVNLAHLLSYGNAQVAVGFPRAVLLQACVAMWKHLLKLPFLDLTKSISRPPNSLGGSSPRSYIQDIYAQLISHSNETNFGRSNVAGASAIFKGEVSETASQKRGRFDMLPYEFFEYAEILQEKVLQHYMKDKMVIICDEANLLPLVEQQDILERYLQLFLTKRFQFLFVAAHFPWEAVPNLAVAFDLQMHLRGWPDPTCIRQIIQRVGSRIQFSDEAIADLWNSFEGHPRKSVRGLHAAYTKAATASVPTVESTLIRGVIRNIEDDYKKFSENWQRKRHPADTSTNTRTLI